MSNQLRSIARAHRKKIERSKQIKLRKHLNADALFHSLRHRFEIIKDHRSKNAVIPLPDVLMSAFAMFLLKDQSVLAFDKRRKQGGHNLRIIFCIGKIPCDSSVRHILDGLELGRPKDNTLRCLYVLASFCGNSTENSATM